jgi:hypothetical protein
MAERYGERSELKELASSFSDAGRKVAVSGGEALVPHKLKPDGSAVEESNFDVRVDISRLSLSEIRFLDVFRSCGWDFDKACERSGVGTDTARRTYRKCLLFGEEHERILAKAKVPSVEYVLARDVDNIEGVRSIEDSEHKSLDRISKILGAFKTTDVSVTQNVFNLPALSPEAEAKLKEVYDTIATDAEPAVLHG